MGAQTDLIDQWTTGTVFLKFDRASPREIPQRQNVGRFFARMHGCQTSRTCQSVFSSLFTFYNRPFTSRGERLAAAREALTRLLGAA